MLVNTVHEFLDILRTQNKFTSIGSYPTFFLMSDGETMSWEAVRENVWQIARAIRDRSRDGWRVVGYDVNWEDPEMYCAHTGERIESAYAED
jgi:hypothetical protein